MTFSLQWPPLRIRPEGTDLVFHPLRSMSVNLPSFTVREVLPAPASEVKTRSLYSRVFLVSKWPISTPPPASGSEHLASYEPTWGRIQGVEWIVSIGKRGEMTKGQTSLYVFWWKGDLLLCLPNKTSLQVNTLRWSILFVRQPWGIENRSHCT